MKQKINMWIIGAYAMFGLAFFSNEDIYNSTQTIFLLLSSIIAVHYIAAKAAFRNGFNIGSSWTRKYIFNIIGEDMANLITQKMNNESEKIGD